MLTKKVFAIGMARLKSTHRFFPSMGAEELSFWLSQLDFGTDEQFERAVNTICMSTKTPDNFLAELSLLMLREQVPAPESAFNDIRKLILDNYSPGLGNSCMFVIEHIMKRKGIAWMMPLVDLHGADIYSGGNHSATFAQFRNSYVNISREHALALQRGDRQLAEGQKTAELPPPKNKEDAAVNEEDFVSLEEIKSALRGLFGAKKV